MICATSIGYTLGSLPASIQPGGTVLHSAATKNGLSTRRSRTCGGSDLRGYLAGDAGAARPRPGGYRGREGAARLRALLGRDARGHRGARRGPGRRPDGVPGHAHRSPGGRPPANRPGLSGPAGLRDLRSRLLRWRVGAYWYVVALLATPLLSAATSF